MRIYDAKTPEGRKVATPNASWCPRCEGREGRHALVTVTERRENAKGRMQSRKVMRECPNGQVDAGVDAA